MERLGASKRQGRRKIKGSAGVAEKNFLSPTKALTYRMMIIIPPIKMRASPKPSQTVELKARKTLTTRDSRRRNRENAIGCLWIRINAKVTLKAIRRILFIRKEKTCFHKSYFATTYLREESDGRYVPRLKQI